jgi:hypothetical protein
MKWTTAALALTGAYFFAHKSGLAAKFVWVDGLTGEPLPAYSGKGRPRLFNSSETKRVGVLWREMGKELGKTQRNHIWEPSSARQFARTVRSEMNTHLNNMQVCNGTMRLEDGEVTCTGDVVKFSKWMSAQGRKKKVG